MTPVQIRMARVGLGWKQADLAKRAGVHVRTIKMVENGRVIPMRVTIDGITRALAQAGAEFNPDGWVWVPEGAELDSRHDSPETARSRRR